MPHRLIVLIGLFSSVDWRALLLFIGAAAAMPLNGMPVWLDTIIRVLSPIVGGIIWVFLKPRVLKWKNRKK